MTTTIECQTINAEDAAEYLGCSVKLLYRYVRRGQIKVIRFGRKQRFRAVDLDEYLAVQAKLVKNTPAPQPYRARTVFSPGKRQ